MDGKKKLAQNIAAVRSEIEGWSESKKDAYRFAVSSGTYVPGKAFPANKERTGRSEEKSSQEAGGKMH